MENINQQLKKRSSTQSPNDVLKGLMLMNIKDAKSIFELAKTSKCLDSQEFINWQDALNAISVKYE